MLTCNRPCYVILFQCPDLFHVDYHEEVSKVWQKSGIVGKNVKKNVFFKHTGTHSWTSMSEIRRVDVASFFSLNYAVDEMMGKLGSKIILLEKNPFILKTLFF
jgi:hypothetical protein